MKKLLFIVFVSVLINAESNYKKILIETLNIAQELLSLPPEGTVRIKSGKKELFITKTAVNTAIGRYNNLPIHYAAQNGTLADLVYLINFGASVDSANYWGQTPLMKAVKGGNVMNVGYLLEKEARLTQENHPSTRFNPFHYAALYANNPKATIAIINALAQFDPSRQYINMESKRGTPLELAIKNNDSKEILQAFLSNGANPTKKILNSKQPAIKALVATYERPILPGV